MSGRTIKNQTDIMWPRLWFGSESDGAQGGVAGAYATDVLLANWINPQQFAGLDALAQLNPAPRNDEQSQSPEVGDFLSRVYANQEC